MKVTPIKKFGKFNPGDVFDLPDKTARVLIKIGRIKLAEVPSGHSYANRMMTTSPGKSPQLETARLSSGSAAQTLDTTSLEANDSAPWGFKADGTPRKRPGRPAAE